MGMTKYELYIHACKFAVGEQMIKGNITFSIHTNNGTEQVTWNDVMEWLNNEQERAEWLKSM